MTMMSHLPYRIILPTDEMIEELRTSDIQLGAIGTNVKDVVRYVAQYWLARKDWIELYNDSAGEQLLAHLDFDFLQEHCHLIGGLDASDINAIRTILGVIAAMVYTGIMPAVDELKLTDSTMQQMRCDGWLGDALVVSTVGTPGLKS
jgi:hypothetical protein